MKGVDIGLLSYGAAALAHGLLAFVLLTSWRGRLQGVLLAAAVCATALWAALAAALQGGLPSAWVPAEGLLEVAARGLWLAFLLRLLSPRDGLLAGRLRGLALAALVAGAGLAVLLAGPGLGWPGLGRLQGLDLRLLGFLVLALLGLVAVEQLYRNTPGERRWAIKFLCLGAGTLFAYDFFLYADALLFQRLDPHLWDARGLVDALAAPLVAVAAARNPQWSLDVFVSRRMVFHGMALTGAGLYLLAMAAAGSYIRYWGGSWGRVFQVAFLAGAGLLLLVLLGSGSLRARLRVFLDKHFFNYRYDYREEWLRLTRALSGGEEEGRSLAERAVGALAAIADCAAGALWLRDEEGAYVPRAWLNLPPVEGAVEPGEGRLAAFLAARGWVVDLREAERHPRRYAGLSLPRWLGGLPDPWLLVPLFHREGLLGFAVLARPRARRELNWEDYDMLRTAGRQVASHLAQEQASEALARARQLEAFGRLSAFVMHDLKNVAAQLRLVVANAERHAANPAFVADAMRTVGHAADKMERLLAQLRAGRRAAGEAPVRVDLEVVAERVAERAGSRRPVPQVEVREGGLQVLAPAERLADVLGHLVQNAQEATPPDGRVILRLRREGAEAVVEVEDTGCGMDEAFVRERLFRPFDSTKGREGMGIGAYEARSFVQAAGGRLEVRSRPGEGTLFRIRLPLAGIGARRAAQGGRGG